MTSDVVPASPGEGGGSSGRITVGGVTFHLPYASLLPPPSAADYAYWRDDIAQHGIGCPLIVDEHMNVIEGHTRLAIAAELGLTDVPFRIVAGLSGEQKRDRALSWNLMRRQLTPEQQRRHLAERRQRVLRERQGGLTEERIAQAEGVSVATVHRDLATFSPEKVALPASTLGRDGKRRRTTYTRQPSTVVHVGTPAEARRASRTLERLEAPPQGTVGLRDLYAQKRAEAWAQRRAAWNTPADPAFNADAQSGIITGDMGVLWDLLPDDSVELFFTDPPWTREALPLYGRLAELAQAKLRPGGLCLAYAGGRLLWEASDQMRAHLDPYWLFTIDQRRGASCQSDDRHINDRKRDVLAFTKRPAPRQAEHPWVMDIVDSEGADKRYHEWGQSLAPALYWIGKLCPDGGLVVDPFAGGGTTAAACTLLGRRWLCTEIKPHDAARARQRLATLAAAMREDKNERSVS